MMMMMMMIDDDLFFSSRSSLLILFGHILRMSSDTLLQQNADHILSVPSRAPTVPTWPLLFSEINSCTAQGCTLFCGSQSYSLSKVVASSNGLTQKLFRFYETSGNYYWEFYVPMCGFRSTSSSSLQTGVSDVIQTSTRDGSSYKAGLMDAASWKRGTYQGADAFSVVYKVAQHSF